MTVQLLSPQEVLDRLTEACGGEVLDGYIKEWPEGASGLKSVGVWVRVPRERFKRVLHALADIHYPHLGVISGADLGEEIELLYHFYIFYGYPHREILVTLAMSAPKTDLTFPTITDIIPGALTSEREKQEMLGVVIEGIPDGRRLFLSEDFPEGVYPWRKDETGIPPEMIKQLWKVGRDQDLLPPEKPEKKEPAPETTPDREVNHGSS